MNKKGLVDGGIAIIMIMFVFIIASAIAFVVWSEFNTVVQGMDSSIVENHTKELFAGKMTDVMLLPDKIFVYMFIALWIGLIITSLRLPVEHPAFFIVYIIATVLVTFVSMVLREVLAGFLNEDTLAVAYNNMPTMVFFATYFHYISLITMLIAGVIFYIRAGQGQGGNVP